MVVKKIIQIIANSFNLGILISTFLPAIIDTTDTYSIFRIMVNSFINVDKVNILIYMVYYIPTIMSLIFISFLKSRFSYSFSLFSATMGLTVTLLNFIFEFLSDECKFIVCEYGIYMILCFQVIEIIVCFIEISIGDFSEIRKSNYSSYNDITTEIQIKDIDLHNDN